MDAAIGVLKPADARLYRTIFAAQKQGDWTKADAAFAQLSDKRFLLGHVLADRYQRRPATFEELAAWLKAYPGLPEAEDLYAQAKALQRKHKGGPAPALTAPAAAEPWSGGYEIDSAANFKAELTADELPSGAAKHLARAINVALHHDNPAKARNLLIAAEAERPLVGTFAADAEAAIAAGYFYDGEREQSLSLATAAAAAHQPLGLWIRGLIAWEQNDLAAASLSFAQLADHPALNPGSRAAAHFWAYRAFSRAGDKQQAYSHLEQAAHQPRSFYGMLAAQLVGRGPVDNVAHTESLPVWNTAQRNILAANPAALQALALIQVGETELAESELRRVNPQGQTSLQRAMLALTGFVPMPALVVQLANLTGVLNGQSYDAASYPLPPWKPQKGFEVDRALLYALARQESQFDPTAVSARGARGLMQIMPETADVMASENGMADVSDKLFDPATNLTLGQKYVRELASRPQIGDNLLLLLAAYNGGPNKIVRWQEYEMNRQDSKSAHDPLFFLESIPQRETRNYITRVLPHYWAYRARLAEPLTSLKQLAEGKWPRFALTDGMVREADALQATMARTP
jgi:soluble lytic murein transglycosylase-like protein